MDLAVALAAAVLLQAVACGLGCSQGEEEIAAWIWAVTVAAWPGAAAPKKRGKRGGSRCWGSSHSGSRPGEGGCGHQEGGGGYSMNERRFRSRFRFMERD